MRMTLKSRLDLWPSPSKCSHFLPVPLNNVANLVPIHKKFSCKWIKAKSDPFGDPALTVPSETCAVFHVVMKLFFCNTIRSP